MTTHVQISFHLTTRRVPRVEGHLPLLWPISQLPHPGTRRIPQRTGYCTQGRARSASTPRDEFLRSGCSRDVTVTAPLSQRKHWLVIVCLFVYSPYRNICKSKSDEKRFNKMDIKILFMCFYPTNVAINLKS
jgi:hypothetical protein